jgi:hypothetical protein
MADRLRAARTLRAALPQLGAVLAVDDALLGDVTDRPLPDRPVRTDPALDLARRTVLARARSGADGFELTERVLRLTAGLCGAADDQPDAPTSAGSSAPSRARP